jgi:hypothetical protein
MTRKQTLRFLAATLATIVVLVAWLSPGPTLNPEVHGLPLTAIVSGGPVSNKALVDTGGSQLVALTYPTSAACYIASVSGQATTSAYLLNLEAPAGNRLTVERVCVGTSVATAAAAVTVTAQRRSSASSGGTALTAEGTGTTAVSKLDPADANFTGVARLGGTPGTGGAVVDQWGFTVGELGAGAADPNSHPYGCKAYGPSVGTKPIVIAAGVANGLTVNVSAAGAGGLAAGSIGVEFCVR